MNILKLIAVAFLIAVFACGCRTYTIDEYYNSRRPSVLLPLNTGINLYFEGVPIIN